MGILLAALVAYNLSVYLPKRLQEMYGLYDMRREELAPFETAEAKALAPALFIVHSQRWMRYGVLIELENPDLTSPFIFAWSGAADNQVAAEYYHDRTVMHYYIEDPWNFYDRPESDK